MKRTFGFVAVLIFLSTLAAMGQRGGGGQRGEGQRANQPARPPMDSTPKMFNTAEYRIRVVTIAEGLNYPYSFTFLPDKSILVNEMDGHLRIIRDGKLDPQPITGAPTPQFVAGRGGLMDIALHPKFADNHLVYFTYDKQGEKGSTQAIARGELKGNQLIGVKDVFVTETWGTAGGHLSARIAFDRNGMLYIAVSDHNLVQDVPKDTSHAGKVLRMRDDGSNPTIFARGFRDPHSLVLIPGTTNDF